MPESAQLGADSLEARTARFNQLRGTTTAFVDSRMAGGQKRNIKLVAAGGGIFENPDMRPAIPAAHNFNMSWVHMPPGGGSNLHDHPGSGAELFIPVDGRLTVYWGEDGEHSTTLDKFDCISIPEGVMRGFRNDTDAPLLMLAIVDGGAAGGGSVRWHPDVLRHAAETGLRLNAQGKLEQS